MRWAITASTFCMQCHFNRQIALLVVKWQTQFWKRPRHDSLKNCVELAEEEEEKNALSFYAKVTATVVSPRAKHSHNKGGIKKKQQQQPAKQKPKQRSYNKSSSSTSSSNTIKEWLITTYICFVVPMISPRELLFSCKCLCSYRIKFASFQRCKN